MGHKVAEPEMSERAAAVDLEARRRSTPVDLLQVLRRAVAEAGETNESLAAHLDVSDRSYPHKCQHGDKPLSLERFSDWPLPVLRKFAAILGDELGLAVADPARTEQEARTHLVAALSYLALPSRMAKAEIANEWRGEERRRA